VHFRGRRSGVGVSVGGGANALLISRVQCSVRVWSHQHFRHPTLDSMRAMSAEVPSNPLQLLDDSCSSLDAIDQLYLEDFASTSSTFCPTLEPRPNLQSLRLSLSFEDKTEEAYRFALKRLMHLAPNLQRLSFNGGYVFRPEEESAQAVLDELRRLRSHLDMLSSVLVNERVPVLRLHFSAIFAFDENTIRSADVPEMLRKIFNFCDDIDERCVLKRGILDFIYTSNGVPLTVRLLFNVSILKNFLTAKRSRFADGSSANLSRFFKF